MACISSRVKLVCSPTSRKSSVNSLAPEMGPSKASLVYVSPLSLNSINLEVKVSIPSEVASTGISSIEIPKEFASCLKV
jgi:hypothetical protein